MLKKKRKSLSDKKIKNLEKLSDKDFMMNIKKNYKECIIEGLIGSVIVVIGCILFWLFLG